MMANRKGDTGSRGFGSMDEQKQREIAAQGGRASHQRGTAHEFDSEEAREAGRKGGHAAHEKGAAHEFDESEARAAGRKGGQASHGGGNRPDAVQARGGSHEQHVKAGQQSHKNR